MLAGNISRPAYFAVATVILSALGFAVYARHQMQMRVVGDAGVLMATDSDGLRELYALYSLPKYCGDPAFVFKSDDDIRLCTAKAATATPEIARRGMILLQKGTTAVSIDRRLLLSDGRLIPWVAKNTSGTYIRDGVVDVELIRIIKSPDESLTGWADTHFLGRTFGPFP